MDAILDFQLPLTLCRLQGSEEHPWNAGPRKHDICLRNFLVSGLQAEIYVPPDKVDGTPSWISNFRSRCAAYNVQSGTFGMPDHENMIFALGIFWYLVFKLRYMYLRIRWTGRHLGFPTSARAVPPTMFRVAPLECRTTKTYGICIRNFVGIWSST